VEDFGETLLLNVLYAGSLGGLAPKVRYFGNFTLVRPLLYVSKKDITALGNALSFPQPPPACTLSLNSRRMIIRSFLKDLSRGNRHVLTNLVRAGLKTVTAPGHFGRHPV
jgi:tRNA(Ile)-lysidine synthase TilS/MesJ